MLDPNLAAALAACVAPGAALCGAEELVRFADPAGNLPALVLLPATAAEAAAALRLANQERVPLVPMGAGTSAPQRAGVAGAVVLASERLNRIVEVDTANLTAIVEPGVRLVDLQRATAQLGLFFPPDPPNFDSATLGGATAVDARGPRAPKYGALRDYALGLEVVLADGTALHTGAKTVKSASGYNLTHLLVGSRGTLCFYTQVTLRLLPQPAARKTLAFAFADLEGAAHAAASLFTAKVLPARLQIVDRWATAELGAGLQRDVLGNADALLICELDGSAPGVDRQTEMVIDLVGTGGTQGKASLEPAEGEALWAQLRHLKADLVRGGPVAGESSAPRDRQPEILRSIASLRARHRVAVGIVADPGTGSLHLTLSGGARNQSEVARLIAFRQAVKATCRGLDGGSSGGPDPVAQELVDGLQAAFDPNGVFSSGARCSGGRQAEQLSECESPPERGTVGDR